MHIVNYCPKCGTKLNEGANFCSQCGYKFNDQVTTPQNYQSYSGKATGKLDKDGKPYSDKNGLAVLLLAIFVGMFGVHRFYSGSIGIGVIQLLTLGGCGIWVLVDIVMLVTGSMKDGEDKTIFFE